MGSQGHLAVAVVMAIHASVFGWLAGARRRDLRTLILAVAFGLLAVSQLLPVISPSASISHVAAVVGWLGRILLGISLTILGVRLVRARAARKRPAELAPGAVAPVA
ncbi:MAG: hypothetical protein HYV63_20015 [Candidatus Schekmanbacteria bacterium]|nr:hypothetical protein [Candidatus Schekmanbacteria bacterium]